MINYLIIYYLIIMCNRFIQKFTDDVCKKVYCNCCIEMSKICKGPHFEHTSKSVRDMTLKYFDLYQYTDEVSDNFINFILCYFHEYNTGSFIQIINDLSDIKDSECLFKLRYKLSQHLDCVNLNKFEDVEGDSILDEYLDTNRIYFTTWFKLFMKIYEKEREINAWEIEDGLWMDDEDKFIFRIKDDDFIVEKINVSGTQRDLIDREKKLALMLGYKLKK